MTAVRAVAATLAVCLAVVLQVSVFPHLAWEGIVPDLALMVVVAAALTRGPQVAVALGFVAGVVLDLAPPADHLAGRWALALVLVGYVAGRVRQDARPDDRPNAWAVVATVAACSFLGTSVFAISGLVVGDTTLGVGEILQVIGVSLVWDVLLTPLVLPPVMALFRRIRSDRALA